MKHKDSEEMLSGAALLEVYSEFTQWWEKRAKKGKKKEERGRRWDENIATRRSIKMKDKVEEGVMANPAPQDLQNRGSNRMDSEEHELNTGEQLKWMVWLRHCGPGDELLRPEPERVMGEDGAISEQWTTPAVVIPRTRQKKFLSFNLRYFNFHQSKAHLSFILSINTWFTAWGEDVCAQNME